MKQNILDTSKDLFLRQGFKTVSMDDIAQTLGISKKTIYQHFSSKDELVEASLNYIHDLAMDSIRSFSGTCETPIHEHYQIDKSFKTLFGEKVGYTAMFQLKKYYPKLAQDFQEKRYLNNKIIIHNNLQDGIDKGLYRKDINKDFVYMQFLAGSLAFFYIDEFQNENSPALSCEQFHWNFLEYYFRAIVTTKGLKVLENIINNNNNQYEI